MVCFFVKINFVRLIDFRNVEFQQADIGADSVWVCGDNAQGKTNLLEALGMLGAMRSFRTTNNTALIRQGAPEAKLLFEVEREDLGKCEIEMTLAKKRSVFVDGEKTKFSDFIGKFPTIAATNEDVALVRGSPETRRRELDMFASSLNAEYLAALRRYCAALDSRNAMLRGRESDIYAFESFELEMAKSAQVVSLIRKDFLNAIAKKAESIYAKLAGEYTERARFALRPNCDCSDAKTYADELAKNRRSDLERGSTSKGPHRDDYSFQLDGMSAKTFASEGQQRSLALAFKLAEFELMRETLKITPVLLCDDVLPELDAKRRATFWTCIGKDTQIIASATTPAPSDATRIWKTLRTSKGVFAEEK